MSTKPQLPNLDDRRSVMSVSEVNAVFTEIMHAAENNEDITPMAVMESLSDAIFTRGQSLELYDENVSTKIFEWIKKHWRFGDYDFSDIATSILVNIDCSGRVDFMLDLITKESSPDPSHSIIKEVVQGIKEINKHQAEYHS